MNGAWTTPEGWLLHAGLAGGLLLWLTWRLVRRTASPGRQQRLAEWGLTAAFLAAVLCAAPAWLTLSVPLPTGWRPEKRAEKSEKKLPTEQRAGAIPAPTVTR